MVDWSLTIYDTEMSGLLSRLTAAASSDPSRLVLQAVAFTDEWVMATDSYIAVRIPTKWFGDVTGQIGDRRARAPKALLKRALGPKGLTTIGITGDEMVVTAHRMACHIPLDTGGYPDITSLFEGTPDTDLRTLLSVELLKRTSMVFGGRYDVVLAPFGRVRPARVVVDDVVVGLVMPIKFHNALYDDVFGQIEAQ